ncbi:M6 family metalloprotease-like protein [Nakamurella sp. UYEF19]|uniref:metalloprotease n=1 Tax=Nakamurella sp. UYEF19 TaxID=1756392 RepID=UPI0033949F8C
MPVAFAGEEFTLHNPAGSEIRVRGWGNQFQATFETADGYTVVKNPATGFFDYARLSPAHSSLVATAIGAGSVDPATLDVEKHARTTPSARRLQAQAARDDAGRRRWEERRQERRSVVRAAAGAGLAAPPPLPTAPGPVTGLCLLGQFPDVPGTITQQQIDDFCNLPGYSAFGNNGSVHDYFLKVSGGKLQYRNKAVAYYTAAHNRSYCTDPAIPYTQRARELIVEALDHLTALGHDFGQLSSDSSGFVFALNVFYAGGAVNNWSEGLGPHSCSLASFYQVTAGTELSDYQITDIGTELTLRTFCHENSHMVCDFPDLYDYGNGGGGVGNYCLMCYGGSDLNPVEVNVYLKNAAGRTSAIETVDDGMEADVEAGRK